jgi:hypothetical protein
VLNIKEIILLLARENMNEISLLIKLIIFNLVIFFFWYLATFRSFQIIHFVVVKIVLTIALIWSSLWLIPKIIEFSDFDIEKKGYKR